MLVSGNFFRVLDVEPRLGRGFRDDEDQVPGRDAVVVLSADFWKREFAGDPSVVGRAVRLNGKDFTVIGVAPETFTGLYIFDRPDFYMPLAMARMFSTDPTEGLLRGPGRPRAAGPGAPQAGHDAEAGATSSPCSRRDLEREYPKTNRDRGAAVRTMFEMRTQASDANWKFGVIFTILAFAVLLVACTNAAGLLSLPRPNRTREIAVRLAIGAGRLRLIRLLLTESLVLALAGGLCGIAIGYVGIHFMGKFRIPAELPVKIPFQMDTRVLLASFAFSVLSALLCGLAPALQSTRLNLVKGLKSADGDEAGRTQAAVGPQRAGRRAGRDVADAAHRVLPDGPELPAQPERGGVRQAMDHLLMARFDPRLVQYDAARTERFYELLAERARQTPCVRSAGLTQSPPLSLGDFGRIAFVPEGFSMPRDRESFRSPMDTVDEGYFETMGIPILRGRGFRAADTAAMPRVAIVNE